MQEPELSSSVKLVQEMAKREFSTTVERGEAEAVLRGVLMGPRKLWLAVQSGLVTPSETANAVAAHVHQWLMDLSGSSWGQPLPSSWDDFIAALESSLFSQRS